MTFEEKKRANLIFTLHNIDESQPYLSMRPTQGPSAIPLTISSGLSWWDHDKGRYRTAEEQREFEKEVLSKNAEYNATLEFSNSVAAKELKDEIEKSKKKFKLDDEDKFQVI